MGFRIFKILSVMLFVAAGLWMCGGHTFTDEQFYLPKLLGGLALLVSAGVFGFVTKDSYKSFRVASAGVCGSIALFTLSGGILGLLEVSKTGWDGQEVMPSIGMLVGGLITIAAFWYVFLSTTNIKKVLENIFQIPELIGKLLFTVALLSIYRIGFHIPLPGLNQGALARMVENRSGGGGGVFGQAMEYFSIFTGGSLSQSTLFGLGIMPYITASIIFMLLVQVVPAFEKLQKEGPAGHKKIQEYTRYATVGLCIFQSIVFLKILMSQQIAGEPLIYPGWSNSALLFVVWVLCLTAGTMFLMWLGEQIDEYGIGNGISLLIMAGIVVRMPAALRALFSPENLSFAGGQGNIGPEKILLLAVSFVFVVAGSILITQGQRRIPIQQAKQTRGRRVYGGQRHYIPLRVNHGGVMPIIFASSLMIFPGVIAGWIAKASFAQGSTGFAGFMQMLPEALKAGSFTYTLLYVGMIFFFAYFWTTVNFRPKDMSDQLRDMGHFIPGLRPGKRTADYLESVMERITYCGAAFLAIIAVLPMLIAAWLDIPFQISAFLGGTGLLIMVSVTLDLIQRIEAQLVMRNYGGFLGAGTRMKGAQ